MDRSTIMTFANDLAEARRRIAVAYDPGSFREAGQRLIELLADQLGRDVAGQGDVLPWRHPGELVVEAGLALDAGALPVNQQELAGKFQELVRQMLRHGINLHNPRYVGHQVAASVPMAGLFDAVGAVTNQGMAIYEMGPWGTAAEQALIQRLGQLIGWKPDEFAGIVTHGGSLANLTALLTARNVALGNCWEDGIPRDGAQPVLLVQADAHYSVARSAGVLGLGTNQVVKVGLDERRRMDPKCLEGALKDALSRGHTVVAVVACACATPIGAFDPLTEISQICKKHDVWLHVDAAHGGATAFSSRHRHLLAGMELADSIVWDAHKMLFVPALCTFVLYRRRADSFQTFRQNAPYLFDPSAPGLAEFDSGVRTLECTKRSASLGLWGIWSLFGPQLLADLVDVTFDLGALLYEKLSAAGDFQPLHQPQCNIVVFRYVPPALADWPADRLGKFQFELRRRIIESGRFYLVSTNLDGAGALRVTLINPLTTADHLDELLQVIREQGRKLLGEQRL